MKARSEKQREKEEREADERREAEDRERDPVAWAAGLRKQQEVSHNIEISPCPNKHVGYHKQDKRPSAEKGRPQ